VTLDELLRRHAGHQAGGASDGVPSWTRGCFRRRAITFCTGETDSETLVLWLQTRGLTADLRLPARWLSVAGATPLAERPPEELGALADVLGRFEGGLAQTRWDGRAMHWTDWTSFQTHDRWPEPGLLARVGDCLIEQAPSGAYVEDWRLQPSAPGPLIGLRLVEQRNLTTGQIDHRGGGLVVCGDHAALVLGRPRPLDTSRQTRLDEFVRANLHDRAALRAVFAFEASVAKRPRAGDDFTVVASTNPTREGEALGALGEFTREGDETVKQRLQTAGGEIERRFTIDTLEAHFTASLATPATAAAEAWLAREARTLLAASRASDRG